jgi:hypothetical protein
MMGGNRVVVQFGEAAERLGSSSIAPGNEHKGGVIESHKERGSRKDTEGGGKASQIRLSQQIQEARPFKGTSDCVEWMERRKQTETGRLLGRG